MAAKSLAQPLPVIFKDQRYHSRTLVLAAGRVVHVVAGKVQAYRRDRELVEYLDQHIDFRREG